MINFNPLNMLPNCVTVQWFGNNNWNVHSRIDSYYQENFNTKDYQNRPALIEKPFIGSWKKIKFIQNSLILSSYQNSYSVTEFFITALDPAQPGFEGAHPVTRVDSSDADLVDVIHTSANHFIASLGLGMISSIGTSKCQRTDSDNINLYCN